MTKVENCSTIYDPSKITLTNSEIISSSAFFKLLDDMLIERARGEEELTKMNKARSDKNKALKIDFRIEQLIAKAASALKNFEIRQEIWVNLPDKNKPDYDAFMRGAATILKAADDELKAAEKNVQLGLAAFDAGRKDRLTKLTAYNAFVDGFMDSLQGADDLAPTASLLDFLRAEKMSEKFQAGTRAFWLEINLIAAGGNRLRKSQILFDLFRRGPDITYAGGAVASYSVFDSDGNTIMSDLTWAYTPFKSPKKLNQFKCLFAR